MLRLPLIPALMGALSRGRAREQREFGVTLRLAPQPPLSREELENMALEMAQLVEDRAGDAALGVVGGCDFVENVIEVDFAVMATRSSQAHAKVGKVVRLIEDAFPDACERSSATEAVPVRHEPILA